jgi:hypothetical protein
MDWHTLRAKFEGRKFKVGWQKKEGRKLAHKTYAFLYNEEKEHADDDGVVRTDERIEIEFFTKPIIIYYPDGSFKVNNHGYWRSQCTRDRFSSFLPGFGRISSWSFRRFETYNSMVGDTQYAWTFSSSMHGSKIWNNDQVYDAQRHREDLPEELNSIDANDLIEKIRTYANASIDALFRGDLDTRSACSRCLLAVAAMRQNGDRLDILNELHILTHVIAQDLQWPLIWIAAAKSKRPMHVQAVDLLLPENRPMWKYAKTARERAARVQRYMLQPGLTFTVHPSHFRKTLRWNMTAMLLSAFGFDYGTA